MKLKLLFYFICCTPIFVTAQTKLPYKNASLPISLRVKDLVNRMTAEEKFWQLFMIPGDLDNATSQKYKQGLFGFQVSAGSSNTNVTEQLIRYNATEDAIQLANKINNIQRYFVEQTRLGIPIIAFDEALHGLVRKGATAFPQSIGLAASFDTSLMSRVAAAIALETKQRGIRQVLSPVINIATDVRWGRTEETYGEDPYLTSCMAVAYIKAFEEAGIITTPKHFLANVGDGGRDSYPIHASERYLKEIHLPPFKAAITAGAGSIMTSYNSLDGSPATAHKWLLTDVLKREYGFNGFVISDASAVGGANVLHYTATDYADAGKKAINNGLDVIFQTQYEHYKLFIAPFLNNTILKQRLDDAVARVLTAKFKLGLFEHPYVDVTLIQNLQQHRQLAKEAAAKSFVLLQNKNNALPLQIDATKKILVIGEDAIAGRLGGYSGAGNDVTTILQGLKNATSNNQIEFYKGVDREEVLWNVIENKYLFTDSLCTTNGLVGNYYKNINATATKPDAVRNDATINFSWTLYGPDNLQTNEFYSVNWQGFLKTDSTGNYALALEGNDGYKLFINNKLVINKWDKQSYHTTTANYNFEKDKAYAIQVQFYEPTGNGKIKLVWNKNVNQNSVENITTAVAKAKTADAIIVVAGIEEGEFRDRAFLNLPGKQEEVIKALSTTGKPVIVLLVAGSAVQMSNWINDVDAVAQIWYAGEAGGHAVADMLFGKTNPAGRMPFTVPIHESQLPLVYNHKPTGRGDDYNNLTGLPLFPFGYGLSYTQFSYSNLIVHTPIIKKEQPIIISCTVTNIGKLKGEEVVQLYIRDEVASVARPVMELQGFKRIALAPNESKQVTFTLQPQQLMLLNEKMKWVIEPGIFKIMIGASSRDIRLQGRLDKK